MKLASGLPGNRRVMAVKSELAALTTLKPTKHSIALTPLLYLHLPYSTPKGPHTQDRISQCFMAPVTPPPRLEFSCTFNVAFI